MPDPLREVRKLMLPPERPVNADGDWNEVEAALGLKLPGDYKAFIREYGDGQIARFLGVKNPFSPIRARNLMVYFPTRLATEWELRRENPDLWETSFPWRFYPAKDGILQWGQSDNGDEFFWRTKGSPNRWDTVIHDREDAKWIHVERLGMAQTLVKLLTDELPEFNISHWVHEYGPTFMASEPVTSPPRKAKKAKRKR